MRIFITDIETNGFYFDVTKFHCAWIYDVATGKSKGFRPDEFDKYIETLSKADIIVGHNFIDYDAPVLAKLSQSNLTYRMFDTIVLSRMLDPDKATGHSLDAWGKELGILKGDYGKTTENAWDVFSEEMYTYCEQDVLVTYALYEHLCKQAQFDPLNPPSTELYFSCRL